MRVAISVDKRQAKHTHIQASNTKEEALGGELAYRVCRGWRAIVVLVDKSATSGAIHQTSARKYKSPYGGGTSGVGETLCAEVIDGVSLLVRGATEKRSTMNYYLDAAHRGGERTGVPEIAFRELDSVILQVNRAPSIAHERAYLLAAERQSRGQATSNLSGRTGNEYFHARNIAGTPPPELEESDTLARTPCRTAKSFHACELSVCCCGPFRK
jgi:hypothetical protein